ncbi:hypothetical protein FRC14_001101 [Serendipita sp. 396]|nr:hypothetical protein FRC14_001101 [Serendipita sp. 396]KAG8772911.1 hypothetical protein FRC15_002400 [Serendipita sp. 397]KAG8790496.1 hypothetical protein FRC16_000846 [Serendipita sp. 398]KAG8841505.1 hypothetical protein FRB91_004954 [Serendipita sp. 411]KAG8865094.1 hypothetical protein FRC20_009880 [Serendipita sp. 405]
MSSLDVQVFFQQVNHSAAYLWDPPYGSWVRSVSHLFYVMGIAAASPVILLIALDFTSYAIVRTLGIENAHPVSSRRTESPSPVSEIDATATSLKGSAHLHHHRPRQISIPSPSLSVTPPHEYFTTPGGLQAAGLTLFSPPHSPPSSPTPSRKTLGANLRRPIGQLSMHSISDRDKDAFEGVPHFEVQEPSIIVTNDEGETPSVVLVRKRKPATSTTDT